MKPHRMIALWVLAAALGCAQEDHHPPAIPQQQAAAELPKIPLPVVSYPKWYLMLPPLAANGLEVDTAAPLSKWDIVNKHEEEAECEDFRLYAKFDLENAYGREKLAHPSNADEARAARHVNAICIADIDPRFKERLTPPSAGS